MKQRPRIYYSQAQKALMWDRWRKGESLASIARLFDRNHSSVERILKESGGIRPPPRRRSRLALSLAEREEISRGVVAGDSLRSIAASLGRAASTVSRELKRNGGRRYYRAINADQAEPVHIGEPKTTQTALMPTLATGTELERAGRALLRPWLGNFSRCSRKFEPAHLIFFSARERAGHALLRARSV